MSFSVNDHKYMSLALQLAEQGIYTTDPNPRVGCVIVNADAIVGEGWHEKAGQGHAEVNAIANAEQASKSDLLRGAIAYVTLEPCCHTGKTPPCTDALIKVGIKRVVIAMQDPNPLVAGNGVAQLRQAGIQVEIGLLEAQAMQLNIGFVQRMQTGRPYVRNKLAMSLDGRTAMANGESKWITGEDARMDVQHLRARSSAIVTGIGTVLADDPQMTVRLSNVNTSPLRVVIDTNLSIPLDAKILTEPQHILIVTCTEDDALIASLQDKGVRVVQMPRKDNAVDLKAMLEYLAELEVNEVLLETGATLSGSMLCQGLIDELVIYMAPCLMGDQARGLYRLPQVDAIDSMDKKVELETVDVRAIGRDWRFTMKPKKLSEELK